MKEEKMLLAAAADRLRQCEEQYIPTRSDFLDMHQRSLVESMLRNEKHDCRVEFFGGYDDAERVVCCFLPDYASAESDSGLTVARVSVTPGGRQLTHRDYLGSLLGLGIKREKTGDIIVRDDGADIVICEELAEFISLNYDKAGRTSLSVEILPIGDLKVAEKSFSEREDTVASLRLDNIISSAFGISRSKAAEAIKKGIVFVNNTECLKIDKDVFEGDKLVLRGRGKAYLTEIGGTSRKGRVYVKFRVY